MKLTHFLAAGLVCAPVLAKAAPDDFDNRIGAANLVYATPAGMKYTQSLSPAVAAAIQTCIPPGTRSPGSLGKFIFIANVSRTGAVNAGVVRPPTSVATCFAAQFSRTLLPPPPLPVGAKIDYPIVVELEVTP